MVKNTHLSAPSLPLSCYTRFFSFFFFFFGFTSTTLRGSEDGWIEGEKKLNSLRSDKFLIMNVMQPSVFSSHLSPLRSRISSNERPSSRLPRTERGLVQRSLLYCLKRGYFSLIRYLLESGNGNIRERDAENRTVMMYCCFIENDSWADNMAMILLENGARIEDEDKNGLNALHYAIVMHRPILVRRFLASLDFNLHRSIDIHGNTCLHYACSTGNVDNVRAILDTMKRYSVDPTTRNHKGLTAYDVASQFNHVHCRNLLRDEDVFGERRQEPVTSASTVSITTIEPINQRPLSIPARIRPRASTVTSQQTPSTVSIPILPSSSFQLPKCSPTASSIMNETVNYPPPILIDPIPSRITPLRHNVRLDRSLVNQVKQRFEFAPMPARDPSVLFNSSSKTWRGDFSKVCRQLERIKTPSYRQSVHALLNRDATSETLERAQRVGSSAKHDSTQNPSSASGSAVVNVKGSPQRRASITSIKSITKTKKVNFNWSSVWWDNELT